MMTSTRRAARVLGAIAAGGLCLSAEKDRNQAFVFIKPHANTLPTQKLVSKTLADKGVAVSSEGELTGEQIDHGMLIDQVCREQWKAHRSGRLSHGTAPPLTALLCYRVKSYPPQTEGHACPSGEV